jgi:AbrB family looped-hinge helix DNA binding protein
MLLNSKGQVTIPAHLRDKYGLHAGDEVEVVEVGGALQIVRVEGRRAEGSGWCGACETRQAVETWRV